MSDDRVTRELRAVRPQANIINVDVGSRPRMLLVEDDESLRSAIERLLGEGYEITSTGDGAKAAEFLMKDTFDVVLSDIGLPGMSGLDLLRIVRTYDVDVPVVIMTGQPTVDSAIAALELGALTYMQKPVSNALVQQTVGRAVKLSRIARVRREAAAAGVGSTLAGDRTGLHMSLERALDSLTIAFQPIVDRLTRKVMGFEALMRCKEPTMPHPEAVLEAAERLGRLPEVGRRVREVAAATFLPLEDDLVLFVNLHPADLLDKDLFDRAAPLSRMADHVILEITERAALDDVIDTKMRTKELRERGFKIAIDDLGAGYAGLTSFATFEPEVVKLDMSLIRDIHESTVKHQVVESMTTLCRDLGMKVVAEGIETAPELATILDIGCDYLQGYLLGRPGPALNTSTLTW